MSLAPTWPRSVSNSELADFRACKLRWWMRHVRQLRLREPEESAAQTGRLAHELIAAKLGGYDPMARMQELAQSRGFYRTDTTVLSTFRAWEKEYPRLYDGIMIQGLEQELSTTLSGGLISGQVDCWGTRDNIPVTIDHKTTGTPLGLWGHSNELLVLHQLMLYDILRARNFGAFDESSIVMAHVVSTKGEGVRVFEWTVSAKAREQFEADLSRRVGDVFARVETAGQVTDYTDTLYRGLMSVGPHCGNCDYRPLCESLLAGLDGAENVAQMLYEPVPRLAYRQP